MKIENRDFRSRISVTLRNCRSRLNYALLRDPFTGANLFFSQLVEEFLGQPHIENLSPWPAIRKRERRPATASFTLKPFSRRLCVLEPLAKTGNGEEMIAIEMEVARGRGLERFILSWTAGHRSGGPTRITTGCGCSNATRNGPQW
jgi:hypothetical protein